jgi:hypothetical protein
MRLGEILVATGQLTAVQVEHALRIQVMWGGRLGSVLIELAHTDLDTVTRALASQHQMPAALARHFDQVSNELQAMLPATIAAQWQCIPITRLPGEDKTIAIAVAEPLVPGALLEIASHLGVAPQQMMVGVAAEMRIRYHLEKAYGIAREQRFLRSRSGRRSEPPPSIDFELEEITGTEIEADSEISNIEIDLPPSTIPPPISDATRLSLKRDSGPIDLEGSQEIYQAVERVPTEDPRSQRRYMSTLADEDDSIVLPPSSSDDSADEAVIDRSALGRIAIRKAAISAASVVVADEAHQLPETLDAACRKIRRATDRDRVADLTMLASSRFCPGVHTVALFILRSEVAIGWKARTQDRDASLVAVNIVVPLENPNIMADVAFARVPNVVASRQQLTNEVDRRLIDTFAAVEIDVDKDNQHLLVEPINIKGRPVCILTAVARDVSPESLAAFSEIAASASKAFVRLIRAAGR